MNTQSRSGIFPWFTIVEGIAGFFLQCWLFSSINAKELLPTNHIAGYLSFGLLALTMVICCLAPGVKKICTPMGCFSPPALLLLALP